MGRVIAVSNLKGGIGKTTTVVNIGAGLALKGARVLLVDVDAQGNLSLALGVRPRRTIYEVLVDGAQAEDCVTPTRTNLDLIAADESLLTAQPAIAKRADWSRVLAQGLRPLYDRYDFILIDSAGSLTPLNVNALVCAHDVIAPTAIEHFSIKSLELLFAQVSRIKGTGGSIRMILPTLFDPRVRQSSDLLAELKTRYGALVAPPVRINVRLSEAPRHGKTIYEYDPRSRGALDYALIVEHISKVYGFQAPQRPVASPQTQVVAAPIAATPAPLPATVPAGPAPADNRSCPNCGSPLGFATLAGYRVAYCERCKYRTQTLVRGLR
jgi:chromosome partitioning protein